MAKPFSLKFLADNWPSQIVARKEVGRFSGGLLSPKYLANLDSIGKGPSTRLRIGRMIVYPVDSLIQWLENRITSVE